MKTKTHEISDLMRTSQKNVEKFNQQRRGFSHQKWCHWQTNKEINKETGRQTDLNILRNKHSVAEALVLWGNLAAKEMISTQVFRPASLISF